MSTRKHLRVGLRLITGITLLLAFPGCSRTTAGFELAGERIAFIRNGITTRVEVLETLGPPLFDFITERVIAYAWETERGVETGYSVFGRHEEVSSKNHDRFLFCVRFDQFDIVTKHGQIRQLEPESSRKAVLRWVAQEEESHLD